MRAQPHARIHACLANARREMMCACTASSRPSPSSSSRMHHGDHHDHHLACISAIIMIIILQHACIIVIPILSKHHHTACTHHGDHHHHHHLAHAHNRDPDSHQASLPTRTLRAAMQHTPLRALRALCVVPSCVHAREQCPAFHPTSVLLPCPPHPTPIDCDPSPQACSPSSLSTSDPTEQTALVCTHADVTLAHAAMPLHSSSSTSTSTSQ
jgi:hypothetical protein